MSYPSQGVKTLVSAVMLVSMVSFPTNVGKQQVEEPFIAVATVNTTPYTVAPKPPITYPKPSGSNCEEYRYIFEKYNWPVEIALAVCREESRGYTGAVGDSHIPPVSCGLMQIRTLAGRPSCEELKDPETNIKVAYDLWRAYGFIPWSVCKTKVDCSETS